MSLLYAVTCLLLGQRLNLGRGSKLLAIEDEVISRKHLQTFSAFFFFYQGMGGKSQNEKQKRFQDPLVVLLYTYLFHISALYVIFITPLVEVRIMSLAGALERVYVKPAIQTVQRFLKIACTSNTCLRFGKALPILVFFKLHSLRFWKHSIYIFFFAHCNIIGG